MARKDQGNADGAPLEGTEQNPQETPKENTPNE